MDVAVLARTLAFKSFVAIRASVNCGLGFLLFRLLKMPALKKVILLKAINVTFDFFLFSTNVCFQKGNFAHRDFEDLKAESFSLDFLQPLANFDGRRYVGHVHALIK